MSGTPHFRYPGPPPFEDIPEHHLLFCGRGPEVRAITQKIIASRLLVLYGKSGLGKSSLLQAGVFPSLRKENLLPIRVRLATCGAPAQLIVRSSEEASRESGVEYVPGGMGTLWEFFKTAMFWRGDTLLEPVLVFDQFEEIFTLAHADWRSGFAREVGPLVSGYPPAAVRDRSKSGASLSDLPPKVKTVFSLREEYFGSLQELRSEIPGLFQDPFRLLPLSESQAKEAIQRPALLGSVSAPPDGPIEFSTPPFRYREPTLTAMLSFLKGHSETVEPFQLQLLCQYVEQTIVKRKENEPERLGAQAPIEITPDDLGGEPGMSAVVRRFFTDSLDELPRPERRRAQELCDTGLLSAAGHRLMLQEDQIRREFRVTRETLQHLLNKRILREEPRLESVFYEISHDTLAQSILQVRPWRIPRKYHLAGAVGAVLLSVILGSATWYTINLERARKSSDEARLAANKERERAEAARKSSDEARTRAVEARGRAENLVAFLIGEDLLGTIRPMGRLDVLKKVQNEVNDYLEKMSTEERTSEIAMQNQALACLNQGDLCTQRYELNRARKQYENARGVFRKLLQRDKNRLDWRHGLADATAKLASIAADQLRLTEALELNWEALQIRQALIAQASKDERDRFLRDLADSNVQIGNICQSQGHLKEALNYFAEAIRIARNAPHKTTEWLYVLQDGLLGRGTVLTMQGKIGKSDAAAAFQEGLECAQQAAENSPFEPEAHYRIGLARSKLANLQTWQKPEEVLPQYEELHKTFVGLTKWDPTNGRRRRDSAATLILVGEGYSYRKAWDAALSAYREAGTTLNNLMAIDASNASLADDMVWLYRDWGDALAEKHESKDAVARFDEALKILARLATIDGTNNDIRDESIWLRFRRAGRLRDKQDYDAALETCQQALRLVKPPESVDPTDTRYWETLSSLHQEMGDALSGKGKRRAESEAAQAKEDYAGAASQYAHALNDIKEAIARGPSSAQYWNERFLLLYDHVAPMHQDEHDSDGARQAYNEALEAVEQAVALEPKNAVYRSNVAWAHQQIGDQFRAQGKLTQAQASYALGEQAWRDVIGLKPDDADYLNRLHQLFYSHVAPLRSKQGDRAGELEAYREALKAVEQAVALEPKNAVYRSNVAWAHQQIGDQFRAQGDLTQAQASYALAEQAWRDAIGLKPDDADYLNRLHQLFYSHVAPLRSKQGDRAGELEAYREALKAVEQAVALEPKNAIYRSNAAWSHQQIGDRLRDGGELSGAAAAYAGAERAWRDALTIKADADYRDWLFDLFCKHLAALRKAQKDEPGELAAYRQALEVRENEVASEPKNLGYRYNLFVAHERVGDRLREEREWTRAAAAYADADTVWRDAAGTITADAYSPYWDSRFDLFSQHVAPLREQQRDQAGVLEAYREALEAAEKAVANDPKTASYHSHLALAQERIGDAQQDRGEPLQALEAYARAEKALRESIALEDKTPDASRWNELYELLVKVAPLRERQGDQAGADVSYGEAQKAIDRAVELDPKQSTYLANRAQLATRLQKLKTN